MVKTFARSSKLLSLLLAPLLVVAPAIATNSATANAAETWEKLDKRLKGQVLHLNVGLKLIYSRQRLPCRGLW